jgi:DMSO/TMAO reductase YedYZ molybdopterin-dependent catalytic subunit
MKTTTKKQQFNTGFIAGLGAGIIATAFMLILNQALGGISLPEVFGSFLTALMPAAMFDYLRQMIGGDAKHYLFYGIIVGQCLVFALCGGLYNLYLARVVHVVAVREFYKSEKPRVNVEELEPTDGKLQLYQGLLLAFLLWLLVGLVLLPLTGAGIFGASLAIGLNNTLVSLAVVGVVYGLLFVVMQNWLVTRDYKKTADGVEEQEGGLTRRTLLQRGLIIAGIGLLGYGAWRFIVQGANTATAPVSKLLQRYKSKIVPPPVANYGEVHPARFLSPEITSNDQYYVVSKNLFADPTVDAGSWRLTVDGYVDKPYTLNYQELLALPMQQQYESMMCVSNEVGGPYMSNALWEGVRLKDLLVRAGVKSGAVKVVFYATDDYSDSIHLDKALEPTTLLAVHMNGATLPQVHGFPARMLVPGIYGMKHCKWLTRIQVVARDYQGYWQERGWSDPAPIRMTSRIDTPLIGSQAPAHQLTYVGGVAFSGNKGISEVDISLDGGNSWQLATLKRPLSDLTWVLWEYPWQPTSPGSYTLIVRAVDMEGNVQDPNVAPPAPDGSSGYHTVAVSVV